MAEPQVLGCHTVDQWKEHFENGKNSGKLLICAIHSVNEDNWVNYSHKISINTQEEWQQVVVDFTASWCAPCRFIAPVLGDLAKKFTNVLFLKVDVDELKTVAEEFKVDAMPTFVFLKCGDEIDRMVGASKDNLLKLVENHAAASSSNETVTPSAV